MSALPAAVIFDFDDTLVYTNELYDQARDQLFDQLRALGLPGEDDWADYLNTADIGHIDRIGWLADSCFPQAMRDTYCHFAALGGQEPDADVANRFYQLGSSVLDITPRLMEGAEAVLSRLRGQTRLILLTQGELQSQFRRVRSSGLLRWFDACQIVRRKDERVFAALLRDYDLAAAQSWMVGNSIRADINPALAVGLNAVFLQSSAWSYDLIEPGGEFFTIRELPEILPLIQQESMNQ